MTISPGLWTRTRGPAVPVALTGSELRYFASGGRAIMMAAPRAMPLKPDSECEVLGPGPHLEDSLRWVLQVVSRIGLAIGGQCALQMNFQVPDAGLEDI